MWRYNPADEADPERLLRGQTLACQNHFHRFGRPDDPRQPLSASKTRNEAEFDFRQPQQRPGCRYTNVASQSQFEPAADAGAVDGDKDRFLRPFDTAEQRLSTNGKFQATMHGREVRQLMHICPRTEKPSGTGYDHDSHILVLLYLIQNMLQFLEHG